MSLLAFAKHEKLDSRPKDFKNLMLGNYRRIYGL